MSAILVSGPPGCGKTTLVRTVVEALEAPAGGFFTTEVLGADGRRTGFDLETLDGERARLAGLDLAGPDRVGRYGVDVEALERVGVPALESAIDDGRLVVVDEIGKMELLSVRFQRALITAIHKHRVIFGSIMRGAHLFADEVKAQPDVFVFEMDGGSRDRVRGAVEGQLLAALGRLSV